MATETIEIATAYGAKQERVSNPSKRFDRYLRRSDTVLAKVLHKASPTKGQEYLQGQWKRAVDLAIGIPAAIVATPVITLLTAAKKVEDGGQMFFVQQRMGQNNTHIGLIKIRCMVPDSDLGIDNQEISRGIKASEDPRNTPLGSFMRRFQLEELPQLFQVITGKLSLLGIRPIPDYITDYLKDRWTEERLARWRQLYNVGRPGLSGLNQVFGTSLKQDEYRYHLDAFYVKHSNLGFDLYLVWKTLIKLITQ